MLELNLMALLQDAQASMSMADVLAQFSGFFRTFFVEFGPRQFCIGWYGVLVRRNAIAVLMATEIMLNGVNIIFVAFNRWWGLKITRAAFTAAEQVLSPVGQIFAIFIIIVAAAEAAVGLAIIIAIYRTRRTANLEDLNTMKW
jgi:NADH:ubiquinone oxidoreductase subunit K